MSKSSNITSSDLIDAKLEEHQLCGSKHCPSCGHKLDSKPDWVGLPAGVKFDPTDQELIEHLEAKVESKDIKSHPLIDEFIPTIEGEDGICYTHPEKLPGVTRDGLSRHFFHRPSKAYTTGTRKRRKIQNECDLQGGETRWHKTGKTRPVMLNGKQKGCKKILVLYTNFGKNRKPEKTNWVMHQYHLGQHEEEKEGELVVSKIFYQTQPRQCNWGDRNNNVGNTIREVGSIGDPNTSTSGSRRDSGGSGSCSSSRDMLLQRDDLSGGTTTASAATAVAAAAVALSAYVPMDIQQLKAEHFGFPTFRKSFDEVGIEGGGGGGEASTGRECDEIQDHHHHLHHQQQGVIVHHHPQHHHIGSNTPSFHITTPSLPISAIISPPSLHHNSIILDDDPYNVSRLILQNEIQQHHQQQQQQQQQQQHSQHHHKLGVRSATGLEELIMGCTPSASDIKEESSIANPQEAEWLKYPSFWPDPDNQDHHG